VESMENAGANLPRTGQTTGRPCLIARAFGLTIAVEADDPDLLQDAIPWLPGGWKSSHAPPNADRHYVLDVLTDADQIGLMRYAFTVGEEPAYQTASFPIFIDYLESNIHHYVATFTRSYLFVHAGVAVWNDRAIVIPGRSFAGKSTLTQALLDAGATYYSDDYAIIDDDGLVHPFPRRLRLRHETAAPQQRVDPFERGWAVGDERVPIGIVAAVRYDAERGWDAKQGSKGAGVLALLSNTVAARERPIDALAVMARAVESALVLEGARDEATDSARRLIDLLETPPGP
jgi:hypothetical protein